MITIQNVQKYFRTGFFLKKKWALKGVNLQVNPGDIFALLGPNGAGKTTLLLCLIGFLDINEGYAKIFEHEPDDIEVYSKISYLPELPNIPTHLNAIEFLKLNAGLNKIKVTMEEINSWLDKVNLLTESKKRIKKYSKGMVQRLAIAAAFMKDCDIYFLDEPILGLDPFGIKMIQDFVSRCFSSPNQNSTSPFNS